MPRYNPFEHAAPMIGAPRQAPQMAPGSTQAEPGGIDPAIVYLLAQAAFNPSTTADYCACDAARAALAAALPSDLFASLERGDKRTPAMDRQIRVALACA